MPTPELRIIPIKARCPETQYSEEFLQGMINRCTTGFLKYGHIADHARMTDWMKSAEHRIVEYYRTGNTEFLIDAANFLMFEFVHPQKESAYFKGTDSKDSPGIVTLGGDIIKNGEKQ